MKSHTLYVDKLTDCIEEVATGQLFETELIPASIVDLKPLFKKDGWSFAWKGFLKFPDRRIYKLVIAGDISARIQGLVSIEEKENFIEVHHAESAPHNRGDHREYTGVAGNLFAFACKESFDRNFDGYIGFTSKSHLIDHYSEMLDAQLLNPKTRYMGINTAAAKKLVNSYYKNYFNGK